MVPLFSLRVKATHSLAKLCWGSSLENGKYERLQKYHFKGMVRQILLEWGYHEVGALDSCKCNNNAVTTKQLRMPFIFQCASMVCSHFYSVY